MSAQTDAIVAIYDALSTIFQDTQIASGTAALVQLSAAREWVDANRSEPADEVDPEARTLQGTAGVDRSNVADAEGKVSARNTADRVEKGRGPNARRN